ncbi:MAG: Heat-inducible transcription repressor HrcA [Chlamydiae bacterium]|nr:Heat-inducible transcription repressor HrcA [Chlamydiota bacterium]
MKSSKPVTIKRTAKQERERQVLLGLIDYYLASGQPVGSETLKDVVFKDLSSATIRNYFANLEQEGYLSQLHASGGRVPTAKAYRLYAETHIEDPILDNSICEKLDKLKMDDGPEIATFLQKSSEILSDLTECAVFISAPRFDNDFVLDMKLVMLDPHRCLCVVITNFGVIRTDILQTEVKLNAFRVKRIESYFHWRLTELDEPKNLDTEEQQLAHQWYNEVIIRFVVGHTYFVDQDMYRTGFSKLLHYSEFDNAQALAKALSLFENRHGMNLILKECFKVDSLKVWIQDDLTPFAKGSPECTVMTIPYYINQKPVGAVGILGPMRVPYRELYGTMKHFSWVVSEVLTRNIYKYQISYQSPLESPIELPEKERLLLEQTQSMLLEDKTLEAKGAITDDEN